MKALTLWRPWAFAILQCGKGVENRPWPPPVSLLGQRILLHNGQAWDEAGQQVIENISGWPVPAEFSPHGFGDLLQAGRIVASARVIGAVRMDRGVVPAIRDFRGTGFSPREVAASPWATGPWVWVLEDARAVNGPLARGHQRLWTPSPLALAQLEGEEATA